MRSSGDNARTSEPLGCLAAYLKNETEEARIAKGLQVQWPHTARPFSLLFETHTQVKLILLRTAPPVPYFYRISRIATGHTITQGNKKKKKKKKKKKGSIPNPFPTPPYPTPHYPTPPRHSESKKIESGVHLFNLLRNMCVLNTRSVSIYVSFLLSFLAAGRGT